MAFAETFLSLQMQCHFLSSCMRYCHSFIMPQSLSQNKKLSLQICTDKYLLQGFIIFMHFSGSKTIALANCFITTKSFEKLKLFCQSWHCINFFAKLVLLFAFCLHFSAPKPVDAPSALSSHDAAATCL